MMLTPEQFASLEVGDRIEVTPMLPGVGDDPLELVVHKRHESNSVTFVAMFCEIPMGNVTASLNGNSMFWVWF